MAHDVFISYSTEDKPTADAVCFTLEDKNIRCWIAPRDVLPGKWGEAINDAIKNSKIMVLVFSSHTNKSTYAEKEVLKAVENGVTIIPLRIENVFPQGALDYYLAGIHWLDALTPPLETHLRKLADEVAACIKAKTNFGKLLPEPNIAKPSTQHFKRVCLILILFAVLILSLFIYFNWYVPYKEYGARKNSFLGAMPWLNWVVYDPTEYDPYKNKMPSEASIRKDLEVLRQYGFNGLITVTSKGTLRHIPRIAHEVGFNMVITGVWDLRNLEEVNAALSEAPYADAYCLGHMGLNKLYALDELKKLANTFVRRAQRPVTTSEALAEYETSTSLVEISDFMFPDVQSYWHEGQTPQNAFEHTVSIAREAAKLAGPENKLVLLKMISYPSEGAEGLSMETQQEFYRLVVEAAHERSDLPRSVTFSFMSAFDPVWKTEEFGWKTTGKHVGLFTVERKPKLAVTKVDWLNKH